MASDQGKLEVMQQGFKEMAIVDDVEIDQVLCNKYEAKAKDMKDKVTYFEVDVAYQSKVLFPTPTFQDIDFVIPEKFNGSIELIDSSEKLDPEVEDILVDIAEDFVDSITTFGCSLAKHRKSTTLEAKDILLHLERNWNITLPGFGGDEIKSYRKPLTNDIHKERLVAIKKSMVASETATKISSGQAAGNAKGNLAKAPANPLAPQM
ncbi:hypothetical protein CMV_030464 [Castanea mollissima]|uniref:Transcription initiation factor TFIID subunit 12 domain-containing protein n=1 Tax=Castanea mollissima TaxID=60419 RepID=A0A8J4V336_9ROSI|nr:hypothetical protein CMV_030464 [Castanea mollissima]